MKKKMFTRTICNLGIVIVQNNNLVPRSLVDEAEGEIWQSKKISLS